MKRHTFTLPLLLSLALCGCTPHVNLNAPFGSRPPNDHEEFYTALASDFQDAKMCEKISDRALDERGPDMGSTDWRVSRQKSACYFYVAMATKDENFCKLVNGIVTLPSNHSGISKEECEAILRRHQQYGYHPSAFSNGLPGYMQEMGYRDEDRYDAQYKENLWNNPVYRFYAKVKNDEDFRTKIRDLPSYDEPFSPSNLRAANEDEMITQMMAVEDEIPMLCGKISPNTYTETPANLYNDTVYRIAVRNSCFSAIALNTHVPALCAQILPAENTLGGVSYINRKNCEDGIRFFIRDHDNLTHYGPQYFRSFADFVHALQKLGYDKPFRLDQNAPDWSAFYMHLEFYGKPEEKQGFLKRAEALPSFTN